MENQENNQQKQGENSQKQIAGAIVLAALIIGGAILLKGSKIPTSANSNDGIPVTTTILAPVGSKDRTMGNPKAKIAIILYEDFQCPFCGVISGLEPNAPLLKSFQERDPTWTPFLPEIIKYVKNGDVQLVYRDWAFLGPESVKSAEAARCAGDQGKFWEYHNYLFSHQSGENQGAFSDPNLKSFAKVLGLNTNDFDKCLDSNKYTQDITDSKNEGLKAGVSGTPKGFILKEGKIFDTIDGAESWTTVKPKIDSALK